MVPSQSSSTSNFAPISKSQASSSTFPSYATSANQMLPLRPLSRAFSTSPSRHASPLPQTTPGPPPLPPQPTAQSYVAQLARKRAQASLLASNQDLRSAPTAKKSAALRKRFWKDVNVKQNAAPDHGWSVMLDSRAVRAPASGTKQDGKASSPSSSPQKPLLRIPRSKPHLAAAIALEWDLLVSAAQALKGHYIPLTSLVARGNDIAAEDTIAADGQFPAEVGDAEEEVNPTIREEIIKTMLRYLDTDTLLCWAPVKSRASEASGLEAAFLPPGSSSSTSQNQNNQSLRDLQIQTATPILSYLTTYLWPGVSLHPALDSEGSLVPRPQSIVAKAVIAQWMRELPAYSLAGLERATLAGKSLCVGARLVGEWDEQLKVSKQDSSDGERFGIEEAAQACSLEVSWQTGMWGEVEDTHDVEREDLRRQLGSVVLLVSGDGSGDR